METKPTLTVKNRKTGTRSQYRIDQEKILIGRESSCFLQLDNREVSRRHAEILHSGREFFLKDLKSNNKTFLNDLPIPPDEKTLLKPGDLIRVGDFEIRFALPDSAEGDTLFDTTNSDILEVKMLKKLLRSLDHGSAPTLEIAEGPDIGRRFKLEGKSQEVTIGRDPACEFQIDSDVISRKHARVVRKWDAVQIEDLGSRNGVFVNKERVRQKVLKDGDRIYLGTILLMFRNPQDLATDFPPAKKKEEKPPPPPKNPQPKKPAKPVPHEAPLEKPIPAEHRFTPVEIISALLGLAVLLGAIWGIWKIL